MHNNQLELIQDKISSLREEIKLKQDELSKLGKGFVQDKTIPLDTRWDFFVENNLGTKEPFIIRWNSLCEFESVRNFPIDYEYYERGRTISTSYEAEELEQLIKDYDTGEYYEINEETIKEAMRIASDLKYPLDYIDYPWFRHDGIRSWVFTRDNYDAYREEVLERYIKSYCYDW